VGPTTKVPKCSTNLKIAHALQREILPIDRENLPPAHLFKSAIPLSFEEKRWWPEMCFDAAQ
jgi:hypothetical protein